MVHNIGATVYSRSYGLTWLFAIVYCLINVLLTRKNYFANHFKTATKTHFAEWEKQFLPPSDAVELFSMTASCVFRCIFNCEDILFI